MIAALNGHMEIVVLLLSYNAAVNISGYNDRTALICAAINGNAEIVNLILNCDAGTINMQDRNGPTALMYAINNENVEIVRALLNFGARLRIEENDALSIFVPKNSDILKLLLSHRQ